MFMSDLFHWTTSYWTWLASAVAALSALILKGPELLKSCTLLYRRLRQLPESPYVASPEDFGVDHNPRFGFRFAYPKKWDRSDPENSDGSAYVNPTYPSVEVRAWGSYPVVWPTLDEWISNTVGPSAGHPRESITVLRKADSGKYCIRQVNGRILREKVPGVRVVYDCKQGRTRYRVMQLFVQSDGPQVGVRCQAPKHLYGSFEQVFLHVCDNLELVETSSRLSMDTRQRRRLAILQMLRTLRPTEYVKTAGIYAGLQREHPELVSDLTLEELEWELLELKQSGLIRYDSFARGWNGYVSV